MIKISRNKASGKFIISGIPVDVLAHLASEIMPESRFNSRYFNNLLHSNDRVRRSSLVSDETARRNISCGIQYIKAGQKAHAAASSLTYYEKRAKARMISGKKIQDSEKGEAIEIAARDFLVNPTYIYQMKKILNDAPDLAEKVKDGDMNIPQVLFIMKCRKGAPILANLLLNKEISFNEAKRALVAVS